MNHYVLIIPALVIVGIIVLCVMGMKATCESINEINKPLKHKAQDFGLPPVFWIRGKPPMVPAYVMPLDKEGMFGGGRVFGSFDGLLEQGGFEWSADAVNWNKFELIKK